MLKHQFRGFTLRHALLSQLQATPFMSPREIAEQSHLKRVPQNLLKKEPRQAQVKTPLRPHPMENPDYKMSNFMQLAGQAVIKLFGVDMDKSRSGPVAGGKYFAECKQQGLQYPDEPLSPQAEFYYDVLSMQRSFSQYFQISCFHYWMLSVRMRAMPAKYGRSYQQKLVDRLFKDMELRMSFEMKINSGRIIETNLKEYHAQLLGLVLSYDEALVLDDITLALALWRNLFNGDPNVDMCHLEAMVCYTRENLYLLNKMSDREFGFGDFAFALPTDVVNLLTAAQEAENKKRVVEHFTSLTKPSQQSSLSMDE